MKIIDTSDVNTTYNFYQKWLKKRYKNKYIKRFNKLAKLKKQEGKRNLSSYEIDVYTFKKGLNLKACEEGIEEAHKVIASEYAVSYGFLGRRYDLTSKGAVNDNQKG